MHVSLFITCLTDLFAPEVGLATVRVLEHFGCTVDFPDAQTCCGQPQFNNGYPDDARPLAQRMIKVFAKSQYVVTPSASCCAMIREHYVPLLEKDPAWKSEAAAFAAKTFELVEFLTKVLKADVSTLSLPQPTAVTCHYTCHNRGIGMTPAPNAALASSLGNVKYIPLEKADQCCGFGGTFAVKYADISGTMVQQKTANAAKSGAQVLIVNDAGCAMNIAGKCHRENTPITVQHIAQLLASAIEAQSTTDKHG